MKPDAIVLHVSASTWGDRNAINDWHRQRGFTKIGYHYVILQGFPSYGSPYKPEDDGRLQKGRADNEQGAHCLAGGMNSHSLGVCLIGNPGWTPKDKEGMSGEYLQAGKFGRVCVRPYMTRRQHERLIGLLVQLCMEHKISPDKITQHSDHDKGKPLCASLNIGVVRKQVKEAIERLKV